MHDIENLFMGQMDFLRLLKMLKTDTSARKIIAQLIGFDLDPNILVGDLPLNIKQWITIARSILTDPKLLILDESSAALILTLRNSVRLMQSQGCTIFIVTHRIAELTRIADRATVLRDGKSVGKLEKHQINEEHILELIAGPCVKSLLVLAKLSKLVTNLFCG